MSTILSLLRWGEWGGTKLPMVCGAIAYALGSPYALSTSEEAIVMVTLPALVALHASFGYAANSWSDIESDRAASKPNPFHGVSVSKALSLVTATALLTLAGSFLVLSAKPIALGLSLSLFVCSVAYSLRPVRLKERGIAGLIVSAVAQRSLPALIVFAAIGSWSLGGAVLVGAMTVTGLRFILAHQMADLLSDRRSSTRTFVSSRGAATARFILTNVLAPAEILLLILALLLSPFKGLTYEAGLVIAGIVLAAAVLRRIPDMTLRKRVGLVLGAGYSMYFPLLFAASLATESESHAVVIVVTAAWSFVGLRQSLVAMRVLLLRGGQLVHETRWTPFNAKRVAIRERVKPGEIRSALDRGLASVVRMQQRDGSFPLFSKERGSAPTPVQPTFATGWLLIAIGDLLPADSVQRAAGFIQSVRDDDGTWNFDPALGIPNDADSLSVALRALAVAGSQTVGDSDAALLRTFWREPSGPFRTWRFREKSYDHPDTDDVVVCCNVLTALALSRQGPRAIEIESVVSLVKRSPNLTRYYLTREAIGYSMRRAGLPLDRLPQGLTEAPRLNAPTLSLAQWVATFPDQGAEIVPEILARQREDGSWDAEGWFTGVGLPQWGSAAVVTATCVEALSKFLKHT